MSNDATVMGYQECLAWSCRMINANIDSIKEGRLSGIAVEGPPGCGKTMMRHDLSRLTGLAHQFIIKLGHHEVYEVAGLPVPNEATKRTHFYPSADILPPEDLVGGLLFTSDESGDLTISQQNLLCQLIHERRLHSWAAPLRTFFFITSNRVADRSGANRTITKLNNRIARATMRPIPDETFTYGAYNGWNPTLLAFIKTVGGELINPSDKREEAPTFYNSFDPSDPTQKQFSSCRSLEFVSDYLNYIDAKEPNLPEGHVLSDLSTIIGQVVAGKITGYRKMASMMPDPHAILRGEKVPACKQEILWALTLTLVNLVKKDSVKHLHSFLDRGPDEYLALAARLCFDTKVTELSGKDYHAMLQNPKIKAMFAN